MEAEQGSQARSTRLRKACFSCIRSKRRCDKNLPTCRRCVDKELVCRYPLTRPYARRAAPSSTSEQLDEQDSGVNFSETAEEASAPGIDLNWSNEDLLSLWVYPNDGHAYNQSKDTVAPQPLINSDWFLRDDCWSVHEYDIEEFQQRLDLSHWRGYVKYVRNWLYRWVTDSHCPFIHRRLYSVTGLPSCLQDAYSMLTAYMGKTEKNEEFVMQLVEDKADTLLRQHRSSSCHFFPPALTGSWVGGGLPTPATATNITCNNPNTTITNSTYTVLEHLAQVQALFIYQFIRLFDGDIRNRAQAEQHRTTLLQWQTQMWEAAKLKALCPYTNFSDTTTNNLNNNNNPRFTSSSAATSADPHEATGQVWEDWILSESIRRTWIVVTYTHSVYSVLRGDQGDCPGSVAYTLRRGLWDAPTATEWARQLATARDPLFMRSDPPRRVVKGATPRDVNEFALAIVSIMWDARKVDAWFATTPDVSLEALMSNEGKQGKRSE